MNVHRITLDNTSFEGRNNAYLLKGAETVLVDVGVATPETRGQLRRALSDHGLDFADVDRVLLTHWHQDHGGLAGEIQAAGGASIHVHPADAPLVRADPAARRELADRHREAFEEWGMPDDKRAELLEVIDGSGLQADVESVEPIHDGDAIEVNGRELTVVHAPGHTAGQCCFAFDGERGREVFSGDAVLPVYTPNVGGADIRVDRPLTRYVETLKTFAEREYVRAWPGHRDPISDPTGRARDILTHHEERAWNVLAVLRDHGPADTWTVSARLFGDLESIHIVHGPGEAHAHLDHLERAGDVVRTPDGYALADGTAERMASRTDARWPL